MLEITKTEYHLERDTTSQYFLFTESFIIEEWLSVVVHDSLAAGVAITVLL